MRAGITRTIAGLFAALLLAGCLPALAAPAPAAAAGPCTDVELVGLRGSSEDYLGSEHGMGSLIGPVADTVATQLSGQVTFGFYGVPYRAAEATIGSVVFTGDYFESKEEGGEMLQDYLLERAIDCPASRFVVMGYSQGAHAAGDWLARADSFITDRIAALVMFGDPRFNPEASYVWGSYDSRDHGLAGARSLSDFSSWNGRVLSFCRQNDEICQGIGWGHNRGDHDQPRYVSDYANLIASLVRIRLGLTDAPHAPLDLGFVIDSTGSMSSSIDEVRSAVTSIVAKLEEKDSDFRVGLVDYKDTDQGDPYAAQLDLDLTRDVGTFAGSLAGLSVYGGGDYPEAVYSGLMRGFTGFSWRPFSRKAVILMGDAPAKNPEPITGYTEASVLDAADAVPTATPLPPGTASTTAMAEPSSGSATVYPLAVGSGPLESFEPLATGTGGALFLASESSTVSDQVVEAVGAAAQPVEVVLSSVHPARPGSVVSLHAKASYAGGEISSYAWDFDGDGFVDETTAGGGDISHLYPTALDATVTVTASAEDGHEGSASTPVSISASAPLPAAAPSGIAAASPRPGALQVTWGPPGNLGGGNLAGYQVLVENLGSGKLVAAGGIEPSVHQISLEGMNPGTYSARVAAITEAGTGSEASGSATVDGPPAASATSPAARTAAAGSTAPGPSIGKKKPQRCRKGKRAKRVHGKRRCVKRKRHHARHG